MFLVRPWMLAAGFAWASAGPLAACGSPVEASPAAIFDERGRDLARRPERVVELMELRPGMRVADVGAGDGYLTHRLARAVGEHGLVVATDVDLFQLARLLLRPRSLDAAPITTRVSEKAHPGLEAHRYDRILLAQVDQYLDDRVGFFAALGRALTSDGRLVVTNRQLYRAAVVAAAERAGLTLVSADDTIPNQFVLGFVRQAKETP